MMNRKNKGRANAPSTIAMPPPSSSSQLSSPNDSPVDSHTQRVPLFEHGDEKVKVKITDDGKVTVDAPTTPWNELDLSQTFLNALHTQQDHKPKPISFWRKRRLFFLVGALLGVFFGWLFTEGDPLASISHLDLDSLDLQLKALMADLPSFPGGLSLNVSEMLAPGREWLNSRTTNFEVGRDAVARGQWKKHSVIIVPGIVSSGLESWATTPAAAPFFRKRIWASTAMLRAILSSKSVWVAAMSLDPETGLDADGYKVRAAQGLDAASSFMPGYWIWQKVIENLATMDYDHNDLQLFSYDWRLSYYNLEERDRYFSRLKFQIEMNLQVNKKKTVLVSHSMGGLVVLWFLKWVESPDFGGGGADWCERHINDWVNIAGTMLGVPKAMSALLSGEMRDTVEINAAGVYLLEKYFSRLERAKLFRSWAGAASMMLKGGDAVWGTHDDGAPDDVDNATMSTASIYLFRQEAKANTTKVTADTITPNLTMDAASTYILEHVPSSYQRMLGTNFSFGIERNSEALKVNDNLHTKWTNPLEVRLPNAPSMSIYCLYGTGKETERAYFYRQDGYEQDDVTTNAGDPTCTDADCLDQTPRIPLDMPLSRKSYIDSTVTMDAQEPKVRSGVVFGEGDGTVSLLSLGAMCVEGWQHELYNPAKMKVTTHEILHAPQALDLRGGPTTADHVDILGSSELNDAILDVVSGYGHRVEEVVHSNIRKYAKKIKW